MTSQPLDLDRYIVLRTDDPLDLATTRRWYAIVQAEAPSGTVATVQGDGPDGARHAIALVHRHSRRGHSYLVPLTRDLVEGEVGRIAHAFADACPDLDFDIETHPSNVDRLAVAPVAVAPVQLDHARHLALCTALSKQKHEDWVRERTDAGWRYGTRFSTADKTHPLLRPWHDIPDRFRVPDLTWPEKLLRMLDQHGYTVLHRDDVERLMQGHESG